MAKMGKSGQRIELCSQCYCFGCNRWVGGGASRYVSVYPDSSCPLPDYPEPQSTWPPEHVIAVNPKDYHDWLNLEGERDHLKKRCENQRNEIAKLHAKIREMQDEDARKSEELRKLNEKCERMLGATSSPQDREEIARLEEKILTLVLENLKLKYKIGELSIT